MVERSSTRGRSGSLESECTYWRRQVEGRLHPFRWMLRPMRRQAPAESLSRLFTRQDTHRLLREMPAQYEARIMDLLIAALAVALARWSGQRQIRIDIEGHGREEIVECNISRTVGWFTSPVSAYGIDLGGHGAGGLYRSPEPIASCSQSGSRLWHAALFVRGPDVRPSACTRTSFGSQL